MEPEQNEFDELSHEIRRIIDDNRKFLLKILDEDFEPEEEDTEPPEIEI